MIEKETPAIIQEQTKTLETCLSDYCNYAENLKALKKQTKKLEKDALNIDAINDLKAKIKELKNFLADEVDAITEELQSDETYNELRRLALETDEKRAQAKELIYSKIEKIPQQQLSLQFDVDGSPQRANVATEKTLYINGKKL